MARKKRQQRIDKRATTSELKNNSIDVLKSINLAAQSILFSKTRFTSIESASQKAEAMGLDLSRQQETTKAFIFDQKSAGSFQDMSLRTIEIETGIQAVIGVVSKDSAQELPHDCDAVSQPISPAGGGAMEQPLSEDEGPEINVEVEVEVTVSAEDEIEAFEKIEETQSLGYVFMSAEEADQLTGLKTEFAAQLQALKIITETIAPPTTQALDELIEKSEENHVLIGLLDRVNTGLVLLDEACSKLELDIDVQIDKSLLEELVNQTPESTVLALKTLQDVLAPVVELFDDTSFERFHALCKSVHLSSSRLVQETLSIGIDKSLFPNKEMNRSELLEVQKKRSETFGIEIVSGSCLKFASGLPEDLNSFGDPVNLKFPLDTIENVRSSRTRFKQFANDIFENEESKKIVHERIVKKQLEFGASVRVNPDDKLDQLLSKNLLEVEGVSVVVPTEQDEDDRVAKRLFIPLVKQSEEQRTVLGIVLEPDVVDLHGDTYDGETTQAAAWFFMEEMQNIGKNHTSFVNEKVSILESYATPVDMSLDTPMGLIKIKKNTWLMRVRVKDTKLWKEVKTGELTGFSIGALVNVENLENNDD